MNNLYFSPTTLCILNNNDKIQFVQFIYLPHCTGNGVTFDIHCYVHPFDWFSKCSNTADELCTTNGNDSSYQFFVLKPRQIKVISVSTPTFKTRDQLFVCTIKSFKNDINNIIYRNCKSKGTLREWRRQINYIVHSFGSFIAVPVVFVRDKNYRPTQIQIDVIRETIIKKKICFLKIKFKFLFWNFNYVYVLTKKLPITSIRVCDNALVWTTQISIDESK